MKIVSKTVLGKMPNLSELKISSWKSNSGVCQLQKTRAWDICYQYKYPYNVLCNFTPSHFFFDGQEITSMEGFLQSLKIEEPDVQGNVCKLSSFLAKKLGNYLKRSGKFDRVHLYWQGKQYDRYSEEYQKLLKRVYLAKYEQDKNFRDVLELSKGFDLTHDIGKTNPAETILTVSEFIKNLNLLRENGPKRSFFAELLFKLKNLGQNRICSESIGQSLVGVKNTPINAHFICGENLFNNENSKYISKKYGIKNIVDIGIDAKTASERELFTAKRGLGYINIDENFYPERIIGLIDMYNNGGFSYICSSKRPDANIPLALNFLFNGKSDISDSVIFGSPKKTFISAMKRIGQRVYEGGDGIQSEKFSTEQNFADKLKLLSEVN